MVYYTTISFFSLIVSLVTVLVVLVVTITGPQSPLVRTKVSDIHAGRSCDESKCRTDSHHELFSTPEAPWLEYSCWSPLIEEFSSEEQAYPCADGYEGYPLPDVNRTSDNLWFEENVTVYIWYTCCPKKYCTKEYCGMVEQQCKDKHFKQESCSDVGGDCYTNGVIEPFTCHDEVNFKYPRLTGNEVGRFTQYLCCVTDDASTRSRQFLLIPLAIVSGIGFLTCSTLVVAILSSSVARKQGYNLYVVFTAIPDAVFNVYFFIRYLKSITGVPMNGLKVWLLAYGMVLMFSLISNTWINALLVHRIHHMVKSANAVRRVMPPTRFSVISQAVLIYALSTIPGVWWGMLHVWSNTRTGPTFFRSKENEENASMLTVILLVFLPTAYVFILTIRLLWGKHLPRSGQTRILTLYFLRLVRVYFGMWILGFIMILYYLSDGSRFFYVFGYCIYHLGSTLSVFVALTKPDVQKAMIGLLLCTGNETAEEIGRTISSFWRYMHDESSSSDVSDISCDASDIKLINHEEGREKVTNISSISLHPPASSDVSSINRDTSDIEQINHQEERGKAPSISLISLHPPALSDVSSTSTDDGFIPEKVIVSDEDMPVFCALTSDDDAVNSDLSIKDRNH